MVATQVPRTIMQEVETRVEYQQYQQVSQPYTMAAQPVMQQPVMQAAPMTTMAMPTTTMAMPTSYPTTSMANANYWLHYWVSNYWLRGLHWWQHHWWWHARLLLSHIWTKQHHWWWHARLL